jgi:hypothetical protein
MRIDTHHTLGNRKKQCVAITFKGSDDLSDSQWISRMVDFCNSYVEYLEGKGTKFVPTAWVEHFEKLASAKGSLKHENFVIEL